MRQVLALLGVVLAILAAVAALTYRGSWGGPPPLPIPDPPPEPPSAATLTFTSDPWEPYAGVAGSLEEGYIVELARAVFAPLGYRVEFVNRPWSRCIEETRKGTIVALAGADRREVPDFVFPEEAIGFTRPTLFTLAGSAWTFRGLDSLAEIRLGVIQDYTYTPAIDRYMKEQAGTPRLLVVGGNDPLTRLFAALAAGKIGAFVENRDVALYTGRKLGWGPERLREAGAAGPGVVLYLAFSPARPDSARHAREFDAGLRRLRADGTLARILSRYGIEDWRERVAAAPQSGAEEVAQ